MQSAYIKPGGNCNEVPREGQRFLGNDITAAAVKFRTSQSPVRTMSMAKEGTAADWVCQVSNTFHQVESPGRVGIGALLKFNFGRVEHSVVG